MWMVTYAVMSASLTSLTQQSEELGSESPGAEWWACSLISFLLSPYLTLENFLNSNQEDWFWFFIDSHNECLINQSSCLVPFLLCTGRDQVFYSAAAKGFTAVIPANPWQAWCLPHFSLVLAVPRTKSLLFLARSAGCRSSVYSDFKQLFLSRSAWCGFSIRHQQAAHVIYQQVHYPLVQTHPQCADSNTLSPANTVPLITRFWKHQPATTHACTVILQYLGRAQDLSISSHLQKQVKWKIIL